MLNNKLNERSTSAFHFVERFLCVHSGARFQRMQVSNPPSSGKNIAKSKDVHREVESEGSWMWRAYDGEKENMNKYRT